MATDYPDVIGEYVPASKRFEVDGLQYVGVFEPDAIKLGGTAKLLLYLQNTLNVPLKIQLKLSLPQSGRFRPQPILETGAEEINVDLAEAEVGILIIPVTTAEQAVPGEHQLGLEFKVQHSRNAAEIRRPKAKNPLASLPIDSPVGLNLVAVIGTTYTVQNGKKSKYELTISGQPAEQPEPASLKHTYQKLWELDLAQSQHDAQIEVNKLRVRIVEDLKVEPLFAALYTENQRRFLDAGLQLRIGESIALGKLLTYTTHLFLSQPDLQDGLLCPIWERAIFNSYSTAQTLPVIKDVGYRHILRLSTALSFGLIAQAGGQQPWSQEERWGVVDYLTETLEDGAPLDLDFLYLPLMMGALSVIKQVRLPDEDVAHTIRLVQSARQARLDLFADEEMQPANQIYNTLLQKALA